MRKIELLEGDVFGRWIVIREVENAGYQHRAYLCKCICGKERLVEGTSLKAGNSKSCGCLAVDLSRARLRKRPYECLYKRLIHTASLTDRELTISYEVFVNFTKIDVCDYCGMKIVWKEFAKNKHSGAPYNLDRKNNALGYHVDNCVVCCGSCNQMKGDRFSYEEFKLIGDILRKIYAEREVSDVRSQHCGYEEGVDSNLFGGQVSHFGSAAR